jgi:hypothetical protein
MTDVSFGAVLAASSPEAGTASLIRPISRAMICSRITV